MYQQLAFSIGISSNNMRVCERKSLEIERGKNNLKGLANFGMNLGCPTGY